MERGAGEEGAHLGLDQNSRRGPAFGRACGIRGRMEQQMYGAPVEAKWVETLSKLCAA